MSRINLDIVLGILIGLAASVAFASPWNWEHGLRDYQELLVGVLSLAGAAAAVIAVKKQIQHAQEMEDERRRCRNYAARAAMPHALSSLCSYANFCSKELSDVLGGNLPPAGQQGVLLPRDLRPPTIPAEIVPVLKECIEFGPRGIQSQLADLISNIQVQRARIDEPAEFIQGRVAFASTYYGLLSDVIEIRARADELFSYARREAEHCTGDPNLESICNAALACGFDIGGWPELYRHLASCYRRDNQP